MLLLMAGFVRAGNVRAAANLKSTARDRRWLTERVTGLEKETCSDFSVRLGAHRTPHTTAALWNREQSAGWVGLGWVGVASKAVCLLGGQRLRFRQVVACLASLMWSRDGDATSGQLPQARTAPGMSASNVNVA
jgi:hypothetical protein